MTMETTAFDSPKNDAIEDSVDKNDTTIVGESKKANTTTDNNNINNNINNNNNNNNNNNKRSLDNGSSSVTTEKKEKEDVNPKRQKTEETSNTNTNTNDTNNEKGNLVSDAEVMDNGNTNDDDDKNDKIQPMEINTETKKQSNESNPEKADNDNKEKEEEDEKDQKKCQTKKQPKHVRSKNIDPKVLAIRRRIQVGCRDNDLASAMEAYEEALESKIRLEAQSFYNLLNLCDGLERSVHVGTPKAVVGVASNGNGDGKLLSRSPSPPQNGQVAAAVVVDSATRQTYAFRIKDRMAELNLPLNETAYTAIVRILSRNKEFQKAEEVLDEAERVQQCRPKLRLYSALLIAYCEETRMEDALKCWNRLSSSSQRGLLEISEKESLALMRCAHATGDINVMGAVLTDLADEVAVPSKDTVAAILEWFASPHATHKESLTPIHADDCQVRKLLTKIHNANSISSSTTTNKNNSGGGGGSSMGPVVDTNGWKISSAVEIDTQTGMLRSGCLQGCKLKPVPLSDSAWEEMSAMNETIVLQGQVSGSKSEFAGGKKGKKKMNFSPETRKAEWTKFNDFLKKELADANKPPDVIIDGANVGYFKQNFGSAPKHVDYNQIDWIIQHFAKLGKRVLMVLHERHFANNLMPSKFQPLQAKWEKDGVLYKSPQGMNDDWFWLHASLKFKSLVLTNDEMRDHHFQMLAPRTFLRWKERHQIHFDFGNWEGGTRKVDLVYPPIYSRRIQRVEDGLVVPLAKRGDENRFLDGVHVASDDEPKEETYLCIRPLDASSKKTKPGKAEK